LPHDSQKPPEDGQTCWVDPSDEHIPPTATHWLGVADVSQHPAVQLSPLQQGCPAPPHAWQVDPEQMVEVPPEHDSPLKTHWLFVGSQQPLWHATPVWQHGEPEVPHDSQKPLDVQTCWMVPLDGQVPPTATHCEVVPEFWQQPLLLQ